MTKKDYVTREKWKEKIKEKDESMALFIIGIISIFALIFGGIAFLALSIDGGDIVKNTQERIDRYTFSESDCVNYNTFKSVDHMNFYLQCLSWDDPSEVYACKQLAEQRYPSNKVCTLYCKETKIQNGTECKMNGWEISAECNDLSIDLTNNGFENPTASGINCKIINKTTCTPTSKTVSTFCATPDDIQKYGGKIV